MVNDGTWGQAIADLLKAVWRGFVRFWTQDMVQVVMTLGMFLALASPLLLIVLILWFLDYIGWRSSSGFYTIGLLLDAPGLQALLAVIPARS
jgi:hypothetical protein